MVIKTLPWQPAPVWQLALLGTQFCVFGKLSCENFSEEDEVISRSNRTKKTSRLNF
uniref:Uncharacterized protein n=1 Tax=Candidatus Kentrum sp. LPFa TaxID=2126335 RepID=A0A450X633_9GAMM|nr:MAG: hypothetical protein BECKLPF1236A_GA0070988_104342 [Candidatus Kentron sp. LPFa]